MVSAALNESLTLGARLRYVRGHLSQRSFAEKIGVATGTYQNYERDDREADMRTLLAIHTMGWNINWLLTGEGPERLDALQGAASHGLGLDEATLRMAIDAVESGLDLLDYDMSSEGKSRLVALVYQHAASRDQSAAQVVAFVLRSIKEAVSAGG